MYSDTQHQHTILVSNNFIKKKATHVHKTYTKGTNYNESWHELINSKRELKWKSPDALIHSNKTVRKNCLISWVERSIFSKDLAFLSLQITHIRQCGIKPHRAVGLTLQRQLEFLFLKYLYEWKLTFSSFSSLKLIDL